MVVGGGDICLVCLVLLVLYNLLLVSLNHYLLFIIPHYLHLLSFEPRCKFSLCIVHYLTWGEWPGCAGYHVTWVSTTICQVLFSLRTISRVIQPCDLSGRKIIISNNFIREHYPSFSLNLHFILIIKIKRINPTQYTSLKRDQRLFSRDSGSLLMLKKWDWNTNFLVLDLAGIFMQESRQIFNLSLVEIYYQICHLKPQVSSTLSSSWSSLPQWGSSAQSDTMSGLLMDVDVHLQGGFGNQENNWSSVYQIRLSLLNRWMSGESRISKYSAQLEFEEGLFL